MNTTMMKKAKRAAEIFLTEQGYKILERDWRHDDSEIAFIANDCESDVLVLVACDSNESCGQGFFEDPIERAKLERIVAAYLSKNVDKSTAVRLDIINVLFFGGSKIFLKQYKNALG